MDKLDVPTKEAHLSRLMRFTLLIILFIVEWLYQKDQLGVAGLHPPPLPLISFQITSFSPCRAHSGTHRAPFGPAAFLLIDKNNFAH